MKLSLRQYLIDFSERLNTYCYILNKRTPSILLTACRSTRANNDCVCRLFDSSQYLITLRSNISPCRKATTLIKFSFIIKNLFMLSVRISSYGCTREIWRARKIRTGVARGAAESNSSFLSALQTPQVHP